MAATEDGNEGGARGMVMFKRRREGRVRSINAEGVKTQVRGEGEADGARSAITGDRESLRSSGAKGRLGKRKLTGWGPVARETEEGPGGRVEETRG